MASCNTTLENIPHVYWRYTFGVLMIVLSVLAMLGNGVFLHLFYAYPILRTSSNKILASMVTADFLTGLIVCPLYAAQLLDEHINGNCMLHGIRRFLATVVIGASVGSIAFISFDRTLHLVKLQNYSMSNKMLYGVLFVCWLVPIILPLIGLLNEHVHSTVVFVSGVVIVVVITTCYVVLILALKRRRYNQVDHTNHIYLKNERKAGKTVIIIITIYAVMLLPMFIEKGLHSAKYFDNDSVERAKSHLCTISLIMSNSVVNPVIYCSRIATVRKYAAKLFTKGAVFPV